MSEWKKYRKKDLQEMRDYVHGESMAGISTNNVDWLEKGGKIARNKDNHKDQWYIAKKFFDDNYELVE